MTRLKIDGIIEAVRYSPSGLISMVRTYERHGAVWSDHILLGRNDLVHRLQNGKHYLTGKRKAYLGGVFESGTRVRFLNESIFTEGQEGQRDLLADVPVF
jgi:hypothetical protein